MIGKNVRLDVENLFAPDWIPQLEFARLRQTKIDIYVVVNVISIQQ